MVLSQKSANGLSPLKTGYKKDIGIFIEIKSKAV